MESHQAHRRLHAYRRTKTVGRPADPVHDILDGGPGEFTALDRVHGVAPGAPQIACVQAHEDGREACERTLSLDRDVHLVEEELLPLSDGDGRLGLHDATDARGPT